MDENFGTVFMCVCGLWCCVKLFGNCHKLFSSLRLLVLKNGYFAAAVSAVIKGQKLLSILHCYDCVFWITFCNMSI